MRSASPPLQQALISVSNKKSLLPFCQALHQLGYQLIATSGSEQTLTQANIPCRNVADLTGQQEIFGGRLKTLHMQLYAGVLHNPSDPAHVKEAQQLGINPISLVAINFYPVPPTPANTDHIDIGGPALLRAAAKNYHHVIPICDPNDYETIIAQLQANTLALEQRTRLAAKALHTTACYDAQLSTTLTDHDNNPNPTMLPLLLKKHQDLRYGENPHQPAALYINTDRPPFACGTLQQVHGTELSYNNLLDINAGVQLVQAFTDNTATIIKHGNPCGVASGDNPCQTFLAAKEGDARSAFGGVVVLNYRVDQQTAAALAAFFCVCVAAPSFSDTALQLLTQKKNLRIVPVPWLAAVHQEYELRSLTGAWLVQKKTHNDDNRPAWQVVTTTKVAPETYRDLLFAQRVVKQVKSNAVVLVKDRQLLAAGGGQTSRIDALQLAVKKLHAAGHKQQTLVLASDGFFPFADWVGEAKACGVSAVIQPGGSKRDHESITACNQHGIGMIFSGVRGFSH